MMKMSVPWAHFTNSKGPIVTSHRACPSPEEVPQTALLQVSPQDPTVPFLQAPGLLQAASCQGTVTQAGHPLRSPSPFTEETNLYWSPSSLSKNNGSSPQEGAASLPAPPFDSLNR